MEAAHHDVIGVDPHKSSLTAAALETDETTSATRRFALNKGTGPAVLAWAARFEDVLFAVEGAQGLGRGISQFLLSQGHDVLDVPSTLSMKARVLHAGGGRKTDAADARAVGWVAQHHEGLRSVATEDHAEILDLLTRQRDGLQGERTRALNRLHDLFRDLIPGGVPRGLTLTRGRAALRGLRPATAIGQTRRDLARDLIGEVARLEKLTDDYERRIAEELQASGTSLMGLQCISTIMAGKILGEVGDVRRFRSAGHFASYTGAAPLDTSSGDNLRQRLNPGGNRRLNSVLHVMAVCQIQHGGLGRDYYLKKLAEGKTPRKARRALKRRLSNVIYRKILKDLSTGASANS
ncbi:IS110 family transposase [Nesterenkonia sp. AY15]|uniref:IS110 family transposase n=1 Tax=Nesterenkonia sp. AY15 TaxID=2901139 RepID=UPI001F4C6064|nr:IS110 family transposase [Nesterenkonia sp. AY15]